MGDSTTRQMFWSTAKKLNGTQVFQKRADERDAHADAYLEVDGARLKFLWDPWLNSTALRAELASFRQQNAAWRQGRELPMDGGKRRSILIFIGGGLMHARHLKDNYLPRFKQAIDQIIVAASPSNSIRTFEKSNENGYDGIGNQLFFSPIMEPVYDRLSPSREVTIEPLKIQAMNEYLEKKSKCGLKVPWVFRNMTQGWPELMGENGMHVNDRVASKMVDVVLNFRCNAKSAQKDGYPYSRTCCTRYRRLHWVQILATVLVVPLVLVKLRKHLFKSLDCTPYDNLAAAALMVEFVMWYCYIADRTHVFDKFPQEFANIDFRIILGVAVLACLVNVKSIPCSVIDHRTRLARKSLERASFLPREQSDEFKGWMQIYMLAFGYTGASDVLDFYEVFRIFITMYLFLSGYGHATYFLQKKDYSLRRLVSVLVRLNALPVLLAFTMSRPYTSYYFAPLVSFWFLVIYATLGVGRRFNESLWCLVGKVMVSASLVTAFIHLEGILELLFMIVRGLFRASIEVSEWRFHLGMDRYIVFVGMLVAAVHMHTSTSLRTTYRQSDAVGRVMQDYALVRILLIGLSLVIVPVFWILTRRSHDKEDYNWWVPYVAWLPVISFVILRNSTSLLQRHYCASFAWLGQISLELYLLSNHIWLAGDGRALLRIGFRHDNGNFLNDRWLDFVVLTPVFVWVAWKVHCATGTFTAWILGTSCSVEVKTSKGAHGSGHRERIELPRHGSNLPMSNTQGPTSRGGKTLMKRLLMVMMIIWVTNCVSECSCAGLEDDSCVDRCTYERLHLFCLLHSRSHVNNGGTC